MINEFLIHNKPNGYFVSPFIIIAQAMCLRTQQTAPQNEAAEHPK